MPEIPKMPSMKHLPWSKEDARDQKWIDDIEEMLFYDDHTVITEKLDGSQVCLTQDKVFGRSHGREPRHTSYDMLKKQHADIFADRIPDDIAVFGEWLYAVHSIKYTELTDYFIVFGALDCATMTWLSWEDTKDLAERLGTSHAPELNAGDWSDLTEDMADTPPHITTDKRLFPGPRDGPEGPSLYGDTREGYVIRYGGSFKHDAFTRAVAKCVREDHVSGNEHWKKPPLKTNDLY